MRVGICLCVCMCVACVRGPVFACVHVHRRGSIHTDIKKKRADVHKPLHATQDVPDSDSLQQLVTAFSLILIIEMWLSN